MSAVAGNVHTWGNREYSPHVPAQPLWLFILRIFQLLFALITLALSGYGISVYTATYVYGVPDAYGMNIFTSVYTFIFLAYILVSAFFLPKFYNMWAHLALECVAVIFWLTTFALQANWASAFSALGYARGNGPAKGIYGATAGAAALGAFTWLMFVAALVWLGIQIHHIRTNGRTDTAATAQTKMEPMGGQQTAYPQQTGYPQQPPQGQQYVPTGAEQHQSPYHAEAPAPAQQYGQPPAQQPYAAQQQYQQNMA